MSGRARRGRGRTAGCAAIALVLCGCAARPESTRVEALLGCWYFEQEDATPELPLPWGVELTPDSLEGWPAVQRLQDVRRATTLTPSGPRDVPFAFWRLAANGDSVHLGHPGGGGLAVDVLVPAEDASPAVLIGSVKPVGDALALGASSAVDPARPVRLTAARCP